MKLPNTQDVGHWTDLNEACIISNTIVTCLDLPQTRCSLYLHSGTEV